MPDLREKLWKKVNMYMSMFKSMNFLIDYLEKVSKSINNLAKEYRDS